MKEEESINFLRAWGSNRLFVMRNSQRLKGGSRPRPPPPSCLGTDTPACGPVAGNSAKPYLSRRKHEDPPQRRGTAQPGCKTILVPPHCQSESRVLSRPARADWGVGLDICSVPEETTRSKCSSSGATSEQSHECRMPPQGGRGPHCCKTIGRSWIVPSWKFAEPRSPQNSTGVER